MTGTFTKIMTENGGILTVDHTNKTASFSPAESCFHIKIKYNEAQQYITEKENTK